MPPTTRREFTQSLLGSLMAYGLIEGLHASNLFADEVKPVVNKWIVELHDLGRDLKQHKLKDVEFQEKMEDLYRRVNLPELLRLVQFDKIESGTKLPDNGAANVGFDLTKVEGLPAQLVFGKQIFCLKEGRSIVPHGHDNMCTGFIVLKGEFQGKHYDRLETQKDHYIIKPTHDQKQTAGGVSSISDHKDNVHWFKCLSPTGYVFNVHVTGYDPGLKLAPGRRYLDPEGDKLAGGLVKAMKMTSEECHKKYG
jgi:hypothetical protein